jgi:mono/diheme cytochrome c family protein
VPSGLDDPAKVLIGVEHYAAHCAVCHGAPGVPKGDIGLGLYPPPPDLAKATSLYSSAELFWVLKHGIKMTGMPAWSDHSDEELWATTRWPSEGWRSLVRSCPAIFREKLPHGGHHHPGTGDRDRAHPDHGK